MHRLLQSDFGFDVIISR